MRKGGILLANLSQVRELRRMSQNELANAVGVSRSSIAGYEKTPQNPVPVLLAFEIARALITSLEELCPELLDMDLDVIEFGPRYALEVIPDSQVPIEMSLLKKDEVISLVDKLFVSYQSVRSRREVFISKVWKKFSPRFSINDKLKDDFKSQFVEFHRQSPDMVFGPKVDGEHIGLVCVVPIKNKSLVELERGDKDPLQLGENDIEGRLKSNSIYFNGGLFFPLFKPLGEATRTMLESIFWQCSRFVKDPYAKELCLLTQVGTVDNQSRLEAYGFEQSLPASPFLPFPVFKWHKPETNSKSDKIFRNVLRLSSDLFHED